MSRPLRPGRADGRSGRARPAAGFTLIELVVTLTVLMVLLVIAFRFVRQSTVETQTLAEMNQQQASSRGAMSTIVGDLRGAWTGVSGMDRVAGMSATTLTFYSPDRSPAASIKLRKIKYRLDAATRSVQRSETLGTAVLAASGDIASWSFPADKAFVTVLVGVDNPDVFTFYDSARVETAVAADVDQIKLKFKVDRLPNKFPEPDFFETSIQLRATA